MLNPEPPAPSPTWPKLSCKPSTSPSRNISTPSAPTAGANPSAIPSTTTTTTSSGPPPIVSGGLQAGAAPQPEHSSEPQPQPPARTMGASNVAAGLQPGSLAATPHVQPTLSPHSPLPPTSAEFAQHVMTSGLSRSVRPSSTEKTGEKSSSPNSQPASPPSQPAASTANPTPPTPATRPSPPPAPDPSAPVPSKVERSTHRNPARPRRKVAPVGTPRGGSSAMPVASPRQ